MPTCYYIDRSKYYVHRSRMFCFEFTPAANYTITSLKKIYFQKIQNFIKIHQTIFSTRGSDSKPASRCLRTPWSTYHSNLQLLITIHHLEILLPSAQ